MKWFIVVALLAVAAYVVAGGKEHNSIPVQEWSEKMTQQPGVVLDVRTPDEYSEGHVAGAELINFYDEDFKTKLEAKPKDQTYYIYCRSGGRSGKTLKMMKEMGFERVYDMAGGMLAWNNAGMPVEK